MKLTAKSAAGLILLSPDYANMEPEPAFPRPATAPVRSRVRGREPVFRGGSIRDRGVRHLRRAGPAAKLLGIGHCNDPLHGKLPRDQLGNLAVHLSGTATLRVRLLPSQGAAPHAPLEHRDDGLSILYPEERRKGIWS